MLLTSSAVLTGLEYIHMAFISLSLFATNLGKTQLQLVEGTIALFVSADDFGLRKSPVK